MENFNAILCLLLLNCRSFVIDAFPWEKMHIVALIKNRTDQLKRSYIRDISQKTVNKHVVPRDINDMFADSLSGFLQGKVHKIENIKEHVQKLDLVYDYDYKIEPFNYYHRRNKPSNPVGIHVRFSTQVPVNLTRSHVQVPTEIYDYHVKVLNNARMSEQLDVTFLGNYQEDVALLWQYFCSEAGVHRVFPGEK